MFITLVSMCWPVYYKFGLRQILQFNKYKIFFKEVTHSQTQSLENISPKVIITEIKWNFYSVRFSITQGNEKYCFQSLNVLPLYDFLSAEDYKSLIRWSFLNCKIYWVKFNLVRQGQHLLKSERLRAKGGPTNQLPWQWKLVIQGLIKSSIQMVIWKIKSVLSGPESFRSMKLLGKLRGYIFPRYFSHLSTSLHS